MKSELKCNIIMKTKIISRVYLGIKVGNIGTAYSIHMKTLSRKYRISTDFGFRITSSSSSYTRCIGSQVQRSPELVETLIYSHQSALKLPNC